MVARSFDASIDIAVHDLQVRVDLRKLQRQFPQKYPFLLASSASNSRLSRYDILLALPGEQLVIGCYRDGIVVSIRLGRQPQLQASRRLTAWSRYWRQPNTAIMAVRNV